MIPKQFFIDILHQRSRARFDLANPTSQIAYQLVLTGVTTPMKSGRRKRTQGDILLKMPQHQGLLSLAMGMFWEHRPGGCILACFTNMLI